MSAAAVIAIRIKRIFSFLREHGALSEDTAVPESSVPYSDRWYYRRLVRYGAVRQIGDKCYLDEDMARRYLADRRKRIAVFLVVAVLVAAVYLLIGSWFN